VLRKLSMTGMLRGPQHDKEMMKYLLYIVLTAVLLTAMPGCQPQRLGPQQYMQWVSDIGNGLVKHETVGKVTYTVAYRPGDYQLAKAIADGDSFAMNKNKQTRNHCFIIRMDPVDGKTQVLTIDATEKQEPFMRINYYLSEMQQDIQLAEGQDTLSPDSYIYERYYNVSPSQNLVTGFIQNTPLGDKDLVLQIEDKALHTGKIYFHFDASTLKNIPQLTTQ
jgi:hypothetical protein